MVTDDDGCLGTAVGSGDAQWIRYSASHFRLSAAGEGTPPPPMTAVPRGTSGRWLDGDGQQELPISPRASLTRLKGAVGRAVGSQPGPSGSPPRLNLGNSPYRG